MEIEYKVQNGEVCANLSGELDESSADYVRLSLDELLKSSNFDTQKLVLDFSKVSFMDSTGIGILFGRYKKFIRHDIPVFIKNPQNHVDRILKMTGIYEIMPKIS